ncbi:catalase-like domain-containing protein [Peziza echinospora]|nr:catalase-like domain-containing protein [Peziza echinospora]
MEKVTSTLKTAAGGAMDAAHSMTGYNAKEKDLEKNTRIANDPNRAMTTDFGVNVDNTDVWLKVAGSQRQGPMLLEDAVAREKLQRFDHERIPERVIHARGTGAHGYFKLFDPIPEYSKAGILNDTTRKTPVFVRISTVQGSRGSADTVRDVRGFAIKFYTQEGNWDLVGNNIPVFFIQDAMKFPDIIHAVKPEPHNEIPTGQSAHNNFWDFQYLHTEATHMFMWAMSDRSIPRSLRMMQGFGVNTYTLINAKGERHFVKFTWTPTLGVHSLVWDEALKIAGQDPDFHRKDLAEAIEAGVYPTWKFGVQVLPESRQDEFDFDILDATKVWPEDKIPIRYIGELVLDRVVDEFFTEVEQVAFCTSHIVPGIGFSDDPLLQGRNFSYFDTQISRLGVNWQELPINRPVCPVMNFNRDGKMRHTISKGQVNYWPNRFDAVPPNPPKSTALVDYPEKLVGIKARLNSPKFKEHFKQARMFYNSLSPHEQLHVQKALSFELDHCDEAIVYNRMCQRIADINPALAAIVTSNVGGEPIEEKSINKPTEADLAIPPTQGISQTEFIPKIPTIVTRKIAILLADGYDQSAMDHIYAAIGAAGAIPMIVSARRGVVNPDPSSASATLSSSKKGWRASHNFEGIRSTLVDAVLIPPMNASAAKSLQASGRALHFIREAFGHLKPIGALGSTAVTLLRDRALSDLKPPSLTAPAPGTTPAKTSLLQFSAGAEAVASYGVVTQERFDSTKEGFGEKWKMAKDEVSFIGKFFYQISQHRCWERELDGLADRVPF